MAEVHGKAAVVLMDSFDLSAYLRTASADASRPQADVSVFGLTNKAFIGGPPDGQVQLAGNYVGNGASTPDAVLSARQGNVVNTLVCPRGDLVAGNIAYMSLGTVANFGPVSSESDANRFSSMVHGGGPFPGRLILPRTAYTVTSTSTFYDLTDLTGATTFGGEFALHVTANTIATSAVIKVQHCSTSGGSYVDLVTFTTLGPSTTGAERKSVATGTTINEFVKVVATLTGAGSITLEVAGFRYSE